MRGSEAVAKFDKEGGMGVWCSFPGLELKYVGQNYLRQEIPGVYGYSIYHYFVVQMRTGAVAGIAH